MENVTLSPYTNSFGLSLAVASIANAVLVVVKEKSPAVMAGMKKITGHQWVTHSVMVVGLFFLLGFALACVNGGRGVKLTLKNLLVTVVGGVVLGGLTIIGFYLVGD